VKNDRRRPPPAEPFATLVWTLPVRVWDISRGGCGLEVTRPVETGTSGQLGLSIGGRRHEDDVRIARCQHREGSGARYFVGAELLRTRPLDERSIRLALGELMDADNGHSPSSSSLQEVETEPGLQGASRAPPEPATKKA
jgi:hypothetical protein